MIAFLAPGQGSQKPGMLAPWLELDGIAATAAAMSEAAGLDLVHLGTDADADEIKDTAVTQPLVVATTLLVAQALSDRTPLPAEAPVAGHSVGELAAAALAGVIDPVTAVRLAAERGRAMAECCVAPPTSMAAVLGGDPDEVVAALEAAGLVGANINGGGQIVAAGEVAAIDALRDDPPGGASRVIPLSVAGAFHTRYMAGAEEALRTAVDALTPGEVRRPILTNADGSVVRSGAAYLDLLVRQLTRPVRWDLCMTTLADLGATTFVEFPPAGALTGLVKRTLADARTLAIRKPADLDEVSALLTEGDGTAPAEPATDGRGE